MRLAGNMLGNILIDKFKIIGKVNSNNKELFQSLQKEIKAGMEKHFAPNSYCCTFSKSQCSFRLEFTPTRYFEDIELLENFTDTNLDMPNEEILFSLFEECGFYNSSYAEILETLSINTIHLTKNFVMNNPIEGYIKYLDRKTYKYLLNSSLKYLTQTGGETLVISNKTQDKTKFQTNAIDREFMFYDKSKQLLNKANLKKAILKTRLSEQEIALLPDKAYRHPALILERINLLRVELKYNSGVKTKAIENYLLNTKGSKTLKLTTFLDLLKAQRLYNSLDEFYRAELKKYVFLDEIINDNSKLNCKEQILAQFYNVLSLDLIRSIYEDCGLKRNFKGLQKKLVKYCLPEEYKELYEKIIVK